VLIDDPQNGVTELDRDGLAGVREAAWLTDGAAGR
jgi:hypothetical protein